MAGPGLCPLLQVGAHLMSSQLADEAVELLVVAAFSSASLEGPPASRLAGERAPEEPGPPRWGQPARLRRGEVRAQPLGSTLACAARARVAR
jgi:hypothetical protein